MVRCHHRFDGHEFEQAPGVGDGQASLACCSLWGCKESDMTEQLKWTELQQGNNIQPWHTPFPIFPMGSGKESQPTRL